MKTDLGAATTIATLLSTSPREQGILGMLPGAVRRAFGQRQGLDFHSTIQMPKGCNKGVVERAIDRLLGQQLPEKEALEGHGMLASEKQYVLDVAAEYRAWRVERDNTLNSLAEAATAPIENKPAQPAPAAE